MDSATHARTPRIAADAALGRFLNARGKDTTVTTAGKQLSERLERKRLAQQLPELQP